MERRASPPRSRHAAGRHGGTGRPARGGESFRRRIRLRAGVGGLRRPVRLGVRTGGQVVERQCGWRCWRDGGTCTGLSYQAAGMQELVNAVRRAGAKNVIMLGGVQYSATLSSWLASRPTDSLNNTAASWHIYNFSWCNTQACWDRDAALVAQRVPLVLGELGQNDRGSAFVTALMDWMDARQGGYLAWSWDVWGDPLDLIASYDGTPTTYGQTFKARFSR